MDKFIVKTAGGYRSLLDVVDKKVKCPSKTKRESYLLGEGYIKQKLRCMKEGKDTMNKENSKKHNGEFYKFIGIERYMVKGICSSCGSKKNNFIKRCDVPQNLLSKATK